MPAHAPRPRTPRPAHKAARRARGFTLLELMVVVVLVAIFAVMATPGFLRARQDQRAFQGAQNLAQLFREARGRALGTGAAQLIAFQVGPGGTQRGLFQWLSLYDGANQEIGNCRQSDWNGAIVRGGEGLRELAAVDFNEAVYVDAALETTFQSLQRVGEGTVFRAVCFAPSGSMYAALDRSQMASAVTLSSTWAIEIARHPEGGGATGIRRSVLLTPSGMSRVVSQAAEAGGGAP